MSFVLGLPAAVGDRAQRRFRMLVMLLACVIYAYLIIPSLVVIPMSFGGAGAIEFPPRHFSLYLYREFFTTATWVHPTLQSLLVAALTSIASLLVAAPAAFALVRFEFIGKRTVGAFVMSPAFVPTIVLALGMYLYFSVLHIIGSTTALVLAHTVYVTPFAVVTLAAGIRQLDPAVETAAVVMGAGRLRVLAQVVLPQLVPSLVAAALFAFLISFDEVVLAYFLTAPQTVTLPVRMYSSIEWGISPVIAAISTLLTLLSSAVCLLTVALQPSTSRDLRNL